MPAPASQGGAQRLDARSRAAAALLAVLASSCLLVANGLHGPAGHEGADADGDLDDDSDGDEDRDGDDGGDPDGDGDADTDEDEDGDDGGGGAVVHDLGALEDALIEALGAATVEAIGSDGRSLGSTTGVIDDSLLDIVDCGITLAGATADTVAWASGLPCVTLVFSIHAEEDEDPLTGDGDWGSTGMLVRGVRLAGSRVETPAGLAVSDMDLLDVTESGAFEGGSDYATPFDTALDPQLAQPTARIKELIRDTFTS